MLAFVVAMALSSCSKAMSDLPPQLNSACLLSDKYRVDSSFIRTDTLWKQDNLAPRWIDTIKVIEPYWISWINCPPPIASLPEFKLERRRYVIY